MNGTGYYTVEECVLDGCKLPDMVLLKNYISSLRTWWDDSWVSWRKAKMPIRNKIAVFFSVLSFCVL